MSTPEVTPGYYRHFDGHIYLVHGVGHGVTAEGTDEIPQEPRVAYQAQYTSPKYGTDHHWSRTVAGFTETVNVDGLEVPRFTRVVIPPVPTEEDESGLLVETLYEDGERTIALLTLNGVNDRVRNLRSTTTYSVLDGEGVMFVEDGRHPIDLVPGVSITVPEQTIYHDEGRLVMAATSIPPFDPGAVEFVDL